MSKRDNVNFILMTHCNVNLDCDGEKIELRYRKVEGKSYGVWFMNGENTGLQVMKLIEKLRDKYDVIKVTWKRQF